MFSSHVKIIKSYPLFDFYVPAWLPLANLEPPTHGFHMGQRGHQAEERRPPHIWSKASNTSWFPCSFFCWWQGEDRLTQDHRRLRLHGGRKSWPRRHQNLWGYPTRYNPSSVSEIFLQGSSIHSEDPKFLSINWSPFSAPTLNPSQGWRSTSDFKFARSPFLPQTFPQAEGGQPLI